MSRMNKKTSSKKGASLGTILLLLLFLAVVAGFVRFGVPLIRMYSHAVSDVAASSDDTFRQWQTSIVYDINGDEIKKLKGERDVYYLEYDEISDAAKLAIISVEDKNFTSHRGLDVVGLARSVVYLILNRGRITMGGSTITQQLARNIYLSFEKTYSRKINEIFYAFALEQKYTKEDILEFYLNNVYFANGNYGIEAASQAYFQKTCKDLTISQTAFLCSIPNSPTRYDPYENAEATLGRRDRILTAMYNQGYLSKEQYEKSLAEEISIRPKKETTANDYAETYILKCATEALMVADGFNLQTRFDTEKEKKAYREEYDEWYSNYRQKLYTAGYRIYTSIDVVMQETMQESVSTKLGSSFIEKTDDGVFKVQGAAVCIDNSTGKVVAVVGGREQDQEVFGLNRAYQTNRQPGSAIKPLVVFTPAFEEGYTPDSIVDDSRMTGSDTVNNAGLSYSGSITLRRAVQKSSNVVTYRMYKELGASSLLKYLEEMNFAGLDKKDYIYDTTCIGGFTNGTTPVEMASAYATLANNGTYRNPTCIVKITDAKGNDVVSEDEATRSKTVYSNQASRIMTNVLESCVTDSNATASNCRLDLDIPVACKTGTTSNYVDGWLCGYSPYYTTAVWVGKDIYESVDDLKGNTYPAYIWTDFMNKIHAGITRDMELEDDFGAYFGRDLDTKKEEKVTTEEKEEDEEEPEPEDIQEPVQDQEEDVDDQDENENIDDQIEVPDYQIPEPPEPEIPDGSEETEPDEGGDMQEEEGEPSNNP